MSVEFRPITADELPAFLVAESAGFGEVPIEPWILEENRSVIELDRTLVAHDDGRIIATTAVFSMGMTVPGGASLPVAGVSSVTVAATHRRRGILKQMMQRQLDDVAARGEPMAVLNASEAPIYGRFGYGLASFFQVLQINPLRAAFRVPVDDDLRLRIIPKGEAKEALAAIYDGLRPGRPGLLTHSDAWWDCVLSDNLDWRGGGQLLVVVCDPAPGGSGGAAGKGGFAIYTFDNDHPPGEWVVTLRTLAAEDPAVVARLWRYILDLDLVGTVIGEAQAMDDPLRWLLHDPRQAHVTRLRDYLYVRLLDVERSLATRHYPVADALVLDVVDTFRPATSGRYRVQGDGADARADRLADDDSTPADLRLGIAELGSLYLGGVTARELAVAGHITELTPGAVERATAFFSWPVAPHCLTRF
jgi:predicted acetyltransferase